VARSLRHRRRWFTTHVSDIDFTVTGFILVPVTKVPCGPREIVIFTWPVASCGNGLYLMPVTNMSFQQRASARYLSWLICNTWSVTGALPVTKGDLRPLPKPVFHIVLACGWPLSANGSLYSEWRCLRGLRVEDPSGARKGGLNQPWHWARLTGLGRPAQAHPSLARSPLRSRGSSCIYALCPLHLHHFDDVILTSKMEVLRAWSPVFYALILSMYLHRFWV
jgi:hypothetical protein